MTPTLRIPVPVLALALLVACGDKDTETGAATADCTAPVAAAGVDQASVLGSTITLDASGSEVCAAYVDAGSATWTWHLESAPVDSRLSDTAFSVREGADAATTSFTPDVSGDYVISVTVADPSGSSQDIVVVSVSSGNAPPVADCGTDLVGRVDERAELDGSDSFDPEGGEITYSWALAVAPDCSALTSTDVYNADQPVSALVPDCEGLYLMTLVVGDGTNWSDPDYCAVDVADGNRLPEAEAGESVDLPYCAPNPFHLNGWGSYDLDGDSLQYLWTVVAVPGTSTVTDADFDDPTLPDPQIPWDVPGAYSFELQVHDGTTWSAPDVVTYTVAGVETNTSPVANAGRDQTIAAIGSCTSSSYVWTCGDCPEASALLDGSASYDPDGDGLNYQWTESTGLATFSNDRSAVTDIVIPPQPSEYGVDNTIELEAVLEVRDCQLGDEDAALVTYTCTGEYVEE